MRAGPVQLVLDVPDVLPAWAAAHPRQAARVVFLDANGGQVVETLCLPASQSETGHQRRRPGWGLPVPPDAERPLGLDHRARRANHNQCVLGPSHGVPRETVGAAASRTLGEMVQYKRTGCELS
jgi:hypothetical protein